MLCHIVQMRNYTSYIYLHVLNSWQCLLIYLSHELLLSYDLVNLWVFLCGERRSMFHYYSEKRAAAKSEGLTCLTPKSDMFVVVVVVVVIIIHFLHLLSNHCVRFFSTIYVTKLIYFMLSCVFWIYICREHLISEQYTCISTYLYCCSPCTLNSYYAIEIFPDILRTIKCTLVLSFLLKIVTSQEAMPNLGTIFLW
jgi:hypothetical protein